MIINKTVEISCSAERLWQYLTELEKMQEWNVCLLKSEEISDGELRNGYKSKILMEEGKKTVWYENEILEFNAPNFLKIALSGGSLGKNPMIVTYSMVSNGESVKVDYINEWKPAGLFLKLFQSQIRKKMDKNSAKDLEMLKNKAEKKN